LRARRITRPPGGVLEGITQQVGHGGFEELAVDIDLEFRIDRLARELQAVVLGLQRCGDGDFAQTIQDGRQLRPLMARGRSNVGERAVDEVAQSSRLRPNNAPVSSLTPTVPRFTTSNARIAVLTMLRISCVDSGPIVRVRPPMPRLRVGRRSALNLNYLAVGISLRMPMTRRIPMVTEQRRGSESRRGDRGITR
jgi:hypothetical protein